MSVAVCVSAVLLLLPARALAQRVEDGASTAKIHLGPLGLTPRIALRNLGVDSNVLRSAEAPRKDFTATFEPRLDSWLAIGRARVEGKSSAEWMYFGRSTSERSVGRTQTAMAELRLSRFTPFAGVSFVRTERPASYELNSRLPQTTSGREFGLSTAIGPLLSFDIEGNQSSFQIDRVTVESGEIADSLNRRMTSAMVSARYELTPLTTFVVRTKLQRDRFDLTPLRDSNSLAVSPGVEFKPFALVSGSAFVGYRHFNALDAQVPDYSGMTASVNLNYVAREMTKFTIGLHRDLEYSFEISQPYYLATGLDVTVVQMLGPAWDVVARTGGNRLDYRNVVGFASTEGRQDRTRSWGLGTGHRLPSGVRVGFDVDYMRRASVVDSRGFHGFRFGGSVTYGS